VDRRRAVGNFLQPNSPTPNPRRDLGHACSVGLSESLARRTRLLPISCCATGPATLDMAMFCALCCADSGISSFRPSTDTKLIPQSSPVALSGAILLLYVLSLRNGTFPTIRGNYPVLPLLAIGHGAFSENWGRIHVQLSRWATANNTLPPLDPG
jgi:hypothetical protein